MTRYHANLVGWGMSVPDNVLTNDDLAQMVDTSDEWIRSRSGIVERHIVEEGETTKTMSVDASRKALDGKPVHRHGRGQERARGRRGDDLAQP